MLKITLFLYRTSGIDDLGNKIRNATVVQAAKQTRGDTEAAKKKEELQRRIEETRRTLQSVRPISQSFN